MKQEAKQESDPGRIPPRRLNAVWMINKTPLREISQGRLVKVYSHAHGSSLRAEQFVGTPPTRQRKFEKEKEKKRTPIGIFPTPANPRMNKTEN